MNYLGLKSDLEWLVCYDFLIVYIVIHKTFSHNLFLCTFMSKTEVLELMCW